MTILADGGLINSIKARFGRGKQAPYISRDQAMRALPVRNPGLKWVANDEGYAAVTLPRRNDLTGKALAWMFFVPESKPVILDEVGTFVWKLCDGEHSLSEIATLLCKEYKEGRKEMETSLVEYMKLLGKRGMIAFVVPKDLVDELGDAAKYFGGIGRVVDEPKAGESPAKGSAKDDDKA